MPDRIGLIADLHSHAPGASDLPDAVLEAFRDVDLIVPIGDIGEVAALDRLETVAPIQGTLGQDDPRGDPRLEAVRVIEVGGLAVGVIFQLDAPESGIAEWLTRTFGRPVDAVCYGATHAHALDEREGVLFVNPGSPTSSDEKSVALLEVRDGRASAEILKL